MAHALYPTIMQLNQKQFVANYIKALGRSQNIPVIFFPATQLEKYMILCAAVMVDLLPIVSRLLSSKWLIIQDDNDRLIGSSILDVSGPLRLSITKSYHIIHSHASRKSN